MIFFYKNEERIWLKCRRGNMYFLFVENGADGVGVRNADVGRAGADKVSAVGATVVGATVVSAAFTASAALALNVQCTCQNLIFQSKRMHNFARWKDFHESKTDRRGNNKMKLNALDMLDCISFRKTQCNVTYKYEENGECIISFSCWFPFVSFAQNTLNSLKIEIISLYLSYYA